MDVEGDDAGTLLRSWPAATSSMSRSISPTLRTSRADRLPVDLRR